MLQRVILQHVTLLTIASVLALPAMAWAQAEAKSAANPTAGPTAAESGNPAPMNTGSTPGTAPAAAAPTPPYAATLKDAKSVSGLLQLHHKGNNLYVELMPGDYSSEYIVMIAISRGIAQDPIFGGMTWSNGDDWVWQFRKVGDNVHVVRRNVRFKADANSPEARAVQNAYNDSVLFSMPATMKGPKGGDLIDLTSVFLSDLPQISEALPPGFMFSSQRSVLAEVKAFPENVEFEVGATYASGGRVQLDTVADSRGVTINIHYSITKVPQTGYQPRLADDRVGYFLTVVKDYSSKASRDQFIRYINRWDLQKADASAAVSPPKKPIVFHIEKTVPFKYRKAIYDGIYEWNKAFEKAGFVNAVEVHQQLENDDRDPEDVRYNFFRWITSDAGFAMGPSRVNPYTGQILDADIIFDAGFLSSWKETYETFTPPTAAEITGGQLPLGSTLRPVEETLRLRMGRHDLCRLGDGMPRQLAFGSTAIEAYASDAKLSAENLEKLIQQGLKEVTMHEVGHTLGLRHNFKASKLLSLAEMNDPAKAKEGIIASVMDYAPANIVPKGMTQGDYYTTTLGPYDYWAIEYGYKQFQGDAAPELKKIASRSGEPALQYATDEDTNNVLTGALQPDPDSNRWDLGSDPIEFAKQRAQVVKEMMPGLVDRASKEGDDYYQPRRTFQILLHEYADGMFYVSRYVGGLKTSRSHRGDKDARPPITLIDVKLQRDALALLEENLFNDKPFQFPPELYNQLGFWNWMHWGNDIAMMARKDFGIHDFVLDSQTRVLGQLLSSTTLKRMHDAELRASSETDVLTTAELIQRLTKAVFSEVESTKEGDYTLRKPAISSLRRNLQRSYLKQLSNLALGQSSAPQDCQTVAYAELANLQQRIKALLENQPVASKLDAYSRAHLQESGARIAKVLEAKIELPSP
jgi:hypothetical protein